MISPQDEPNDNPKIKISSLPSTEEDSCQQQAEILPNENSIHDTESETESFTKLLAQGLEILEKLILVLMKSSERKIKKSIPILAAFFICTSISAMTNIWMPWKITLHILIMILNFFRSVLGLAISIGLGLGFSVHVYETLDRHSFDRAQEEDPDSRHEKNKTKNFPKAKMISIENNQYESSFYSIMSRAGYPQPPSNNLLRGQLRTRESLPPELDYNVIGVRGEAMMNRMWPNLPIDVNKHFGIFIDYFVRDFIVSWFGSVDAAIVYKDPKRSGENAKHNDTNTINSTEDEKLQKENEITVKVEKNGEQILEQEKILTTSTACFKASPFLNTLTLALAHLIGQLSTNAADNVNVVELILIKFLKAVTRTLKHYRRARKIAQLRQASSRRKLNLTDENLPKNKISEIAIIKELLIAKRLHKAITFGLDVSSLLFADPYGDKSAQPQESSNKSLSSIEERVLHDRLYNTPLLAECQLDYNRVISNKLCRKLVPAADLSSPMVKTFAVEVVAGSILPSIMSFFVPECINGYIVQSLDAYLSQKKTNFDEDDLTDTKQNNLDIDLINDDEVSTNAKPEKVELEDSEQNVLKSTVIISDDPLDNEKYYPGEKHIEEEQNKQKENSKEEGDLDLNHENTPIGESEHLDEDFVAGDVGVEYEEGALEDDVEELDETQDTLLESRDFDSEEFDIVEDGGEQDLSSSSEINSLNEFCSRDEDECEEGTNSQSNPPDTDINVDDSQSENDNCSTILSLLTLAVIDVQNFVQGGSKNDHKETDWEDSNCRAAVCHLVLVIEAALQHRRKSITKTLNTSVQNEDGSKTNESMIGSSLIDLLMDMTMNIDTFEKALYEKESSCKNLSQDEQNSENTEAETSEFLKPESSTLRTMIVAWLQTGDIYNILRVFLSSKMLRYHFYSSKAIFRHDDLSVAFCNQLKLLDGIDILVDTMAVLEAEHIILDSSASSLDVLSTLPPKTHSKPSSVKLSRGRETEPPSDSSLPNQSANSNQNHIPGKSQITMLASNVKANMRNNRNRISRFVGFNSSASQSLSSETSNKSNENITIVGARKKVAISDHLNFHRNEEFAEKLRTERIQRNESWRKSTIASAMTSTGKYKMIDMVCNEDSHKIHRDLQFFSRVMYGSTLSLKIGETNEEHDGTQIMAETKSPRRMLEVPDDDSSFLLRAQPRPLKPLGVHEDQNNKANSFKSFTAYYEEPVTHPVTKVFKGGRHIRYCNLRYFPSDRTAIIVPSSDLCTIFMNENTKKSTSNNLKQQTLSERIQKERNPCQKATQRAPSVTSVILMGNLMEANDFNYTPRTGKAIDFVYRLSLFERPLIEILGKRFTVQEANNKGVHRADASSLELSDASLSTAIILSGMKDADSSSDSYEKEPPFEQTNTSVWNNNKLEEEVTTNTLLNNESNSEDSNQQTMGIDMLMVSIKVVNSGGEGKELIKHFRTSFIRAMLLVLSARQDAQLQCLLWSVKVGSARQATRTRTEGLLQPTLALLDFANSKGRDKESILIRHLKLGSSYLDREELRKRKILNPRYPTLLRGLNVKIESCLKGNDGGSVVFLYKIRCLALVEVGIFEDSNESHEKRKVFKEEWIIKRSFKEFMALHKHLKTQMSSAAASGGNPRFAAATAAVFAPGSASNDPNRQKKGLLLSLAHAAKIGALGVTKKILIRRKETLDEYLRHLLSPRNPLRRCSELLQFLGADSPLEFNRPRNFIDAHGRSETRRMEMDAALYPECGAPAYMLDIARVARNRRKKEMSEGKEVNSQIQNIPSSTESNIRKEKEGINLVDSSPEKGKMDTKKLAFRARAKSRANAVKLSEAREIVFEFIRHLFDLDNATYFRSKMVSVLRTMSMVVTSTQEFNKVLLDMYLNYMNGEYIGSIVESLHDSMWPQGIYRTPTQPLTQEEKDSLRTHAKEKIFEAFPDQVKTVLGQDISHDGLSVLHEMFQNRVVVKSLGYMIMDMIWLEIFPELSDVLSGTEALDDEE